jgi:hypothetical protein
MTVRPRLVTPFSSVSSVFSVLPSFDLDVSYSFLCLDSLQYLAMHRNVIVLRAALLYMDGL